MHLQPQACLVYAIGCAEHVLRGASASEIYMYEALPMVWWLSGWCSKVHHPYGILKQ